jgi:sec-independent protein translocase protein TatA
VPGWISPWELLILVLVALLIFGPKRLPEMGRSLGRGMREFKDSVTGHDKDEAKHEEIPAAPPAAPPSPPPATTAGSSSSARDNDAI